VSQQNQRTLLAHTKEELEERVVALGGRPFHARIARDLLFAGARSYEEMTSLPTQLRHALTAELPLLSSELRLMTHASDGATKLLLGFPGREEGSDEVETVHIPPHNPKSTKGATLCISTQVGCPVACPFCASGLAGLVRNMKAHEILEQFLRGMDVGPIGRAVVMGIGEPLLNYKEVRAALDVVNKELGLGTRKVTLSTVGFPERVREIATTSPPFQLAISLHTPFDAERDVLVPAMKGVPIEDVLSAGDFWFKETGREITYEYVLLGEHNDTPDHAHELGLRLRGRRANVNLIPWNPLTPMSSDPAMPNYRRPRTEVVAGFQEDLEEAGIITPVRWSRGLESDAACGQLRLHANS
jgi:23S rRNA (adenine2503-C2)-methyltransferase